MALTDETKARRKIMRMADNFVRLSEKLATLMLREGVVALVTDQSVLRPIRDCWGKDVIVSEARNPEIVAKRRESSPVEKGVEN